MLHTERDCKRAMETLKATTQDMAKKRKDLQTKGLSDEKISRLQSSQDAFLDTFRHDIATYENAKKGKFPPWSLDTLGKTLVLLRIANGMTQVELAERLGVNQSQISEDEKDEYHGISVERANKILGVFGACLEGKVVYSMPPERRAA